MDKYRYVFNDGGILKYEFFTLDEIEKGCASASISFWGRSKLVSRDKFIGLVNKNDEREIYENDILHFKTYPGGGFTCPDGTDIYFLIVYSKHNPDLNTLSQYLGFWAKNKYGNLSSIEYEIGHGAKFIASVHDNPKYLL